jgi:hypothetical protein
MGWDSKRGQVLERVVDRLKAITIAGGYHYTVKPGSVVTDPTNLFNVAETELPFTVVEPSNRGDRDYHPANQLEEWFRVLLTTRLSAPGTDPHRKVQAGENWLMDLERTLTVDITLGGLLFDLRLMAPDAAAVGLGTNHTVIVLQEVECHFHRTYGAP